MKTKFDEGQTKTKTVSTSDVPKPWKKTLGFVFIVFVYAPEKSRFGVAKVYQQTYH